MKTLVALMAILVGCSADDAPPSRATPPRDVCESPDLDDPPSVCGPNPALAKCPPKDTITCPKNRCMYQVEQTGDVVALRIGREKLLAPRALLSLAPIAVDPNVSPRCFNHGRDALNWLLRIDRKNGTLTVGGAKPSVDGKTYAFLDESVDGSVIASVCPGFVGPKEPLDLRPQTSRIDLRDGKFTSDKSSRINVPIYDGAVPIVLPLRESYLKDVQISPDGNCIGSFDPDHWCDGDSLGWTTAGTVISKITVEDADHVPVRTASCQSLCAILANDARLVDGKRCKKNPDGTYPEIGDACVGGTSCRNAFRLIATFAAYGVAIAP